MRRCRSLPAAVLAASLASATSSAAGGPKTIAVIDFENINKDKALEWIGTGIAETLTTQLSRVPGLVVVERRRLHAALKEIKFGRSEFVDPATAARIGRVVGADSIVLGSYQHQSGQLRVAARLVSVETGVVDVPVSTDGRLDAIFDLQDKVAEHLARDLSGNPGAKPGEASHPPLTAFQSFSDGVYFWRTGLFSEGLQALDTALREDPRYTEAHFYRGLCLQGLNRLREADEALKQALPRSRPGKQVTWSVDFPWQGRPGTLGSALDADAYLSSEYGGREPYLGYLLACEQTDKTTTLHILDQKTRKSQTLRSLELVPCSQGNVVGTGDLIALAGVRQRSAGSYTLPLHIVDLRAPRVVARIEVPAWGLEPFFLLRNGVLYLVYASTGTIQAVDALTGKARWQRAGLSVLDATQLMRTRARGDVALMVGADNTLVAVRYEDGEDAWSTKLESPDAVVRAQGGHLLEYLPGRGVLFLDTDSGRKLGEILVAPLVERGETRLPGWGGLPLLRIPSLTRDGVLYYLTKDLDLVAARVPTAKEPAQLLWRAPIGRPTRAVARNSHKLWLAGARGDVILVNLAGHVEKTISLGKGRVWLGNVDDDTVLASTEDSLFSLDPTTGAKRWQRAIKPREYVVREHGALFLVGINKVEALDPVSGATLWQQVGESVSPFAFGDGVFVADQKGVKEYSSGGGKDGVTDKEVLIALAAVALEAGDVDAAARYLSKILQEIDTDCAEAHFLMARVLKARGDARGAVRKLVLYTSLVPPSERTREILKELERDHGLLWYTPLGTRTPQGVAYAQGRLITTGFASGDAPSVMALDAATGKVAWEHKGDRWVQARLLPGPLYYYLTGDAGDAGLSHLHAVDLASGQARRLSTLRLPNPPTFMALVGKGKYLYAGFWTQSPGMKDQRSFLFALDATTGKEMWQRSFASDRWDGPATCGDSVVIGVGQEFVALNAASGEQRSRTFHELGWSCGNEGGIWMITRDTLLLHEPGSARFKRTVAFSESEVRLGSSRSRLANDTLYAWAREGKDVRALDVSPGARDRERLKWKQDIPAPITAVIFDPRNESLEILVWTEDDRILDLNPATGAIRDEAQLFWKATSATREGNVLYLMSAAGEAYALRRPPLEPRPPR